jgi:hypothetical protein
VLLGDAMLDDGLEEEGVDVRVGDTLDDAEAAGLELVEFDCPALKTVI